MFQKQHYFHSALHYYMALQFVPKTLCYYFFNSWKWLFCKQVGQEWDICMPNVGKRHFEEWYIQYNNTQCIWAIFQEQKKQKIIVRSNGYRNAGSRLDCAFMQRDSTRPHAAPVTAEKIKDIWVLPYPLHLPGLPPCN